MAENRRWVLAEVVLVLPCLHRRDLPAGNEYRHLDHRKIIEGSTAAAMVFWSCSDDEDSGMLLQYEEGMCRGRNGTK